MRHTLTGLLFLMLAVPAPAQPSVPASPAGAMSLFASSSEVAALIETAKRERKDRPLVALPIVQLAPYRANLEYRAAVGPASIHEKDAELFYVMEGAGTIVTGGSLTEARRTNPENLTGSGIQGGQARKVGKGDVILVPEGTAHWFSAIDGTLVLISLHLPRPATHH